jgi:hypothetical protein
MVLSATRGYVRTTPQFDAGQRVLTSPSAHFMSADIGKPITIPGAGPQAMLGVGILKG